MTKLTSTNGAVQEWYGSSVAVAVDGGRVVIGAPGGGAGAAYVYAEAGAQRWAETKLTASDGATGESFGQSVAVDGDRVWPPSDSSYWKASSGARRSPRCAAMRWRRKGFARSRALAVVRRWASSPSVV